MILNPWRSFKLGLWREEAVQWGSGEIGNCILFGEERRIGGTAVVCDCHGQKSSRECCSAGSFAQRHAACATGLRSCPSPCFAALFQTHTLCLVVVVVVLLLLLLLVLFLVVFHSTWTSASRFHSKSSESLFFVSFQQQTCKRNLQNLGFVLLSYSTKQMANLRVNVGESGGCEQDKASVDDSGSLWWRTSPFWRKLCARIPRKSTPGPFQISSQILSSSVALLGKLQISLPSFSWLWIIINAAVGFFIDSRSMREVMVLPAVELHQTRPPSWQKNLTECEDSYCLSFLECKNPSTLCVLLPELPRMQNLQPCVCVATRAS